MRKERKQLVLAALAGGAFMLASSVASAQAQNTGPSPDLTDPEKGAFTGVEQALSLVAALIDRQGCAASTGSYTLSGAVDFQGEGSATVDDLTIQIIHGLSTFRGDNFTTISSGPSEIDDVDFFGLLGTFWYSDNGEIMYADATFALCLVNCGTGFPGAELYDEHVIKDFFADPLFLPDRFVLDQGLEVITKNNYPRKKYRQTSRYVPPDGGIGSLSIDKVSIAPNNAPQCFIQYNAQVDDFGGGIQFDGTLVVFPLNSSSNSSPE